MIDYLESLGTFRGYDPSLEPYRLYLETMPVKIMLTMHLIFLLIFQRQLTSLEDHLLLFLDSCLGALIHIYLSCMHRQMIRSCEL